MKTKILLLTLVLILSANAFGQRNPAQTDVDNMCNVSAFVMDKDPKGLNVRSKSNVKSKKIGVIPFNADGTVVDIIGSKGNWMKIEAARTADDDSVFSKTGWVYAPLLGITTKRSDGGNSLIDVYQSASMGDSPESVITRLSVATTYRLSGCYQDWLEITVPNKVKPFPAWLAADNQCELPWTSCS